jgi:hypothetical protein
MMTVAIPLVLLTACTSSAVSSTTVITTPTTTVVVPTTVTAPTTTTTLAATTTVDTAYLSLLTDITTEIALLVLGLEDAVRGVADSTSTPSEYSDQMTGLIAEFDSLIARVNTIEPPQGTSVEGIRRGLETYREAYVLYRDGLLSGDQASIDEAGRLMDEAARHFASTNDN